METENSAIVSEIQRQINDWETIAVLHDDKRTMNYVPIIVLTSPYGSKTIMELGLSSRGWWVRRYDGKGGLEFDPKFLEMGDGYWLFPILEFPRDQVIDKMTAGLQKRGLSSRAIESFPFNETVAAALESESDGWTEHALEWVDAGQMTERIRRALEVISNDPNPNCPAAFKNMAFSLLSQAPP